MAATSETVAGTLMQLVDGDRDGQCSIVGGGKIDLHSAILVNAGLGNVLEIDDVHRGAIVHPGDTVIPVALALAEQNNLSGSALLDAIIVGYETAIRIGLAAGIGHYRHWYTTATCGVFGAAAAASRLLQLTEAQTVDALGHAGMMAGGLWQCREEPTDSKQIATVHAATSGLLAARFALAGGRGPAEILEGRLGFFAAACPNPEPAAISAVGDGWKIHDVSFKPWPACRHVHPTIEAALTLRARIGDIDKIQAIDIATYRDALSFADNAQPTTPHAARFSLQHCASVALIAGDVRLEHSASSAIADPMMSALRSKVSVHEAAEISAKYPSLFGARMRVTLKNGEHVEHEVESAKGDPENPMSADEIVGKARSLITSTYDAQTAERFIAASAEVVHGRARSFGAALRGRPSAIPNSRQQLIA